MVPQDKEHILSDEFETGFLNSKDGTQLYYRALQRYEADATLVFVHGFGEHCGRYDHVQRWFHSQGYDVVAFDYRGHGNAQGRRSYVERFRDYIDDLDCFIRFVLSRIGDERRLYLVGHSHGGLIVSSYVLNQPEGIDGVVLSSPYFGLKVAVNPAKLALAKMMANIWPTLSLPTGLPPEHLSTDQEVGVTYANDPLVNTVATARWFVEATKRQQYVLKHANELQLPILLLQAGDDRIADGEVSQAFLAAVGSTDKEAHWYEGMFHEIFNETDKQQVFDDLHRWLQSHR